MACWNSVKQNMIEGQNKTWVRGKTDFLTVDQFYLFHFKLNVEGCSRRLILCINTNGEKV